MRRQLCMGLLAASIVSARSLDAQTVNANFVSLPWCSTVLMAARETLLPGPFWQNLRFFGAAFFFHPQADGGGDGGSGSGDGGDGSDGASGSGVRIPGTPVPARATAAIRLPTAPVRATTAIPTRIPVQPATPMLRSTLPRIQPIRHSILPPSKPMTRLPIPLEASQARYLLRIGSRTAPPNLFPVHPADLKIPGIPEAAAGDQTPFRLLRLRSRVQKFMQSLFRALPIHLRLSEGMSISLVESLLSAPRTRTFRSRLAAGIPTSK
jgi:hypothetical protein